MINVQEKRADYTDLIYKPDEKDTTIIKQKKCNSITLPFNQHDFSIFSTGGTIEKKYSTAKVRKCGLTWTTVQKCGTADCWTAECRITDLRKIGRGKN